MVIGCHLPRIQKANSGNQICQSPLYWILGGIDVKRFRRKFSIIEFGFTDIA